MNENIEQNLTTQQEVVTEQITTIEDEAGLTPEQKQTVENLLQDIPVNALEGDVSEILKQQEASPGAYSDLAKKIKEFSLRTKKAVIIAVATLGFGGNAMAQQESFNLDEALNTGNQIEASVEDSVDENADSIKSDAFETGDEDKKDLETEPDLDDKLEEGESITVETSHKYQKGHNDQMGVFDIIKTTKKIEKTEDGKDVEFEDSETKTYELVNLDSRFKINKFDCAPGGTMRLQIEVGGALTSAQNAQNALDTLIENGQIQALDSNRSVLVEFVDANGDDVYSERLLRERNNFPETVDTKSFENGGV